jgi:hypothetical protein
MELIMPIWSRETVTFVSLEKRSGPANWTFFIENFAVRTAWRKKHISTEYFFAGAEYLYDCVPHRGGEVQRNPMTNLPDDELIWVLPCRDFVHVANIGQPHHLCELACCGSRYWLRDNLGYLVSGPRRQEIA